MDRKSRAKMGKGKRPRTESSTFSRFADDHNEERYHIIQNWSFIPERRVHLRSEEYTEFNEELTQRGWRSLAEPLEKYDPEVVKEFYANAWAPQTKTSGGEEKARVRGCWVHYDRDSINQFLNNPMTLVGDELCNYQRMRRFGEFSDSQTACTLCLPGRSYETNQAGRALRIVRGNMKTLTQIWMTFMLANVTPSKHSSDLKMSRCYIIYCIMSHHTLDIATIISKEIRQFVIQEAGRNPAQSSKSLGFPALLTALCAYHGVNVEPSVRIRPPIDRRFIEKNCLNQEDQQKSNEHPPPQPAPEATPEPASTTAPSSTFTSILEQLQMMKEELRISQQFLIQQNAAIQRGQMHQQEANCYMAELRFPGQHRWTFEGRVKEHESKENKLENRVKQLNSKEKHFEDQVKEFETRERQLETLMEELQSREKLFDVQVKELNSEKKQLEGQARELKFKEKQLEAKEKELELKEKQVEGQGKDLQSKQNQFERRLKEFDLKEKQYESSIKFYEKKYFDLQLERNKLLGVMSTSNGQCAEVKDFGSMKKQFDGKVKELESNEKKFEERVKEYELKEKLFEGRVKEYESKENKLGDRVKQLKSKKKHFEDQVKEFETRERQLEALMEELHSKEKLVDVQVKELNSEKKQLEGQAMELKFKEKQLEAKVKDLELKEKQVEGQGKDLQSKQNQFEGRLKEFDPKEKQYEASVKFYEEKVIDDLLSEETGVLDNDILVNLQASSDPSKLVLDIMQNPIAPQCSAGDSPIIIDTIHIPLLEQLIKISPHVKPHVRKEAMMLALHLKDEMRPCSENSLSVLGLLMLLQIYGLVSSFQEDELLELFEVAAQHKQAVELFRTFGFADKASDFVENLIKRQQHLEAVRFICAYKLDDKNHAVYDLLREHVQNAKLISERMCTESNNPDIKDKARDQEIATLRVTLQCISENKLPYKDVVDDIRDRLLELKQHKATSVCILSKCNYLKVEKHAW